VSAGWLTDWQPGVLSDVGIALELATAALYGFGVLRLRRTGRGWPLVRALCFLGGLLAVAFVLQSGFAREDDRLLWVHVTQHLVLMMLAPPLLALGAPVRLCLAAGSPGVRRLVAGLLHDPSMRLVAGTSAAVVLPLDYYGSMALYLLTPLYRLSEGHLALHELVHVYFLACGLMFWVPLLGRDPAPWRPGYALRLRLVLLGVPVYVGLALALLAQGAAVNPAHPLADLQRGAVVLGAGGVVLSVAGAALVDVRERRRRAARRERADARRGAVSAPVVPPPDTGTDPLEVACDRM
jgi:putative membrane protein